MSNDRPTFETLQQFRKNLVDRRCINGVFGADAVHEDVPVPIFIIRRLDQAVEFLDDASVFHYDKPDRAGTVSKSRRRFEIYGGKSHAAKVRQLSLRFQNNIMTPRFLLILLLSFSGFAQKNQILKITYEKSSYGKPTGQPAIIVFADQQQNFISDASQIAGTATYPNERSVIFPAQGRYLTIAALGKDRFVTSIDSAYLKNQQFEITGKTRKILGYDCKMAKTVINSNHYEVWFSEKAGINAGPSVLGQKLGLVLEISRNGDHVTKAVKVEKAKTIPTHISNLPDSKPTDALTYKDAVWKSRFKTVSLFEKAQVNFDPSAASPEGFLKLSDGSILLRRIKLPEIPAASQVFLEVSEKSLGDAYDRTGTLFAIVADDTDAAWNKLSEKKNLDIPALELMRFFTPFGVGKYNSLELKNRKWQDSVSYRTDISDLLPALGGKELIIGVSIGNYDKGGHEVSAHLTVHPEKELPPVTGQILPLFNTFETGKSNRDVTAELRSAEGYKTSFTLAKPMKKARLRYITTGHGGWERGDEFVPKENQILLDGKKIHGFTPWRTDCGSYRLASPASGNFENGLSSSDYSRANWCPGTMTSPVWIELGDLEAGEHTISIRIDVGQPEGGSSSSWTLSGVLEGN